MILQKPPTNLYRLYNLWYDPENICGQPPVNIHFGRIFPFFKLCNVNLSPNESSLCVPLWSDPFLSGNGLTWFWERLGFVYKGRLFLCGPSVGLGEWGFRFPGLPAGFLGKPKFLLAVLITHRLFVVQGWDTSIRDALFTGRIVLGKRRLMAGLLKVFLEGSVY
jgi:hypothetical protein